MKIIEPSATLIDTVDADNIYAKLERCGRISHLSEPKDAEEFVRKIIRLGHESVLEHVSLTFHIICDRAIQNELVRHRHASFTVESTRYVKYDELTVVAPPTDTWQGDIDYWAGHVENIESEYSTRRMIELILIDLLFAIMQTLYAWHLWSCECHNPKSHGNILWYAARNRTRRFAAVSQVRTVYDG